MARVTFTNDDILRAKLLPPAWYPLLAKKFSEEAAGTDGSALYVWELIVQGGPFNGVPLRFQVSEKALGMGIEFLEACGIPVLPGQPIELEKTVGKQIDGYSQKGEYKGRPQNTLVSFRKRSGAGTPEPVKA